MKNTKKKHFNYDMAFSRNLGWVTEKEQGTIKHKTVAIAGLGGVGGHYCEVLAHMGFQKFHLADFDSFEITNFNRQSGATIENIGRSKLEVMKERILKINPNAEILGFKDGVNAINVDEFLEGVDIYLDGLDFFAHKDRIMLFKKLQERKIPGITVAPIGMGASMLVFDDKSMSFEDYFGLSETENQTERSLRFLVGLAPDLKHRHYLVDQNYVDLKAKKGPSTSMACYLCAGIIATEALKIVLKRGQIMRAPTAMHFDAYQGGVYKTRSSQGYRGLRQRLKMWFVRWSLKMGDNSVEKNEPIKPVATSAEMNERVIADILEQTSKYPNGDNSQPFRFKVEGQTLYVYHDSKRAKHNLNPYNCASIITFGCWLEYLTVVAQEHSYKLTTKLYEQNLKRVCGLQEYAKIDFSFDQTLGPHPHFPYLKQRKTSRVKFKKNKLSPDQRDNLSSMTRSCEQITLSMIETLSPQTLNYLVESEVRGWMDKHTATDILSWLRLNKRELMHSKDGMPWQNLGINSFERFGLMFLRKFPFVLDVIKPIAFIIFGFKAKTLLKSSGGYIVFGLKTINHKNLVDLGRCIASSWLEMTKDGLLCQPCNWGVLPQLYLNYFDDGNSLLSKNREFYKKNKNIFASHLKEGETPVFFFRVGRGKAKVADTMRLPLHELILESNGGL